LLAEPLDFLALVDGGESPRLGSGAGGGAETGTPVVMRPGGGIGAGGSDTGLVAALGEGGGSGAEGS
jgi:hypothetical protein